MAAQTELQAVVTQPDRPSGRGHKVRPTPVKAAALVLGVRVYEPQSLRGFAQEHATGGYDLFGLASYGRILPQDLLDLPRLGALNVHPSLLPAYRGATPIQTALRNGDRETGVTIMLMDAGMDTGDIVLQERTPIQSVERYGELHDRLAELGAQLLQRALEEARGGSIPHRPQQGTAIITHPIKSEDLTIDWQWPGQRIVNAVRAFAPRPAARGTLNGETVKILRARTGSSSTDIAPGTIAGVREDALVVRCGDGAVEILELIAPNRPVMPGASYRA